MNNTYICIVVISVRKSRHKKAEDEVKKEISEIGKLTLLNIEWRVVNAVFLLI